MANLVVGLQHRIIMLRKMAINIVENNRIPKKLLDPSFAKEPESIGKLGLVGLINRNNSSAVVAAITVVITVYLSTFLPRENSSSLLSSPDAADIIARLIMGILHHFKIKTKLFDIKSARRMSVGLLSRLVISAKIIALRY